MRVSFMLFLPVLATLAFGPMLVHESFAQEVPKSSAKLGTPGMAAQTGPLPDPGNLFALGKRVGEQFRFIVVGNSQGGVWGSSTYTSDSVLAAAAVHAGLLRSGEAGVVSVEMVEGLPSYEGSASNGVTSGSYGAWPMGYRLTGVEPINGDVTLPDPGNLTGFRGQSGAVFKFTITGNADGSVWGDGVYTDDTPLATAAVHAGALEAGQAGVVTVEILDGQQSYKGAERNGITSQTYGSWEGSYRILPGETVKKDKLSN